MAHVLSPGVRAVEHFVEKPDLARATAMLAEGGYCWNAGIFLFRADMYLDQLREHAPAILAAAGKPCARRNDRRAVSCPIPPPSRMHRRNRSTMPSWSKPKRSPARRCGAAGPTSAVGTCCTRSAPATR
ncbi:sugar phosphate nucleotidyltransferase [Sphingobium scionense]